jgi:hypothetical protein
VPAAVACLLAALAAFLAWQYAMPRTFESSFLLDHDGVEHFRAALGLPRVTLALAPYRAGFRALFAACWVAYVALLAAVALGAPRPPRRSLLLVAGAASLVVAVAWPPSFSCDIYGYVAYGRLSALHGLNPYLTTQKALRDLGDPVGPFLKWNISSPYGPLWTSICVALAWLLRGAGLFAEVVALKLIAAGAVVAAAWSGRRVAERLTPGSGDLAFLAVSLNPLFIIEGPGNGHSDLVMMALVVVAFDAALAGRTARAALFAGLAGAIKFLPLLLVPWLVLARGRPGSARAFARDALVAAALAALPVVLSFWPYWAGLQTLGGLVQRFSSGQRASAATSEGTTALVLLATYAAGTLWLLRGEPARLLSAWMAVATAIFLFAAGMWLPWYLSWIWLPALLRWDRRAMIPSYMVFCFAVVLTLRYAVPAGG